MKDNIIDMKEFKRNKAKTKHLADISFYEGPKDFFYELTSQLKNKELSSSATLIAYGLVRAAEDVLSYGNNPEDVISALQVVAQYLDHMIDMGIE